MRRLVWRNRLPAVRRGRWNIAVTRVLGQPPSRLALDCDTMLSYGIGSEAKEVNAPGEGTQKGQSRGRWPSQLRLQWRSPNAS